jgi:hypothetical protein
MSNSLVIVAALGIATVAFVYYRIIKKPTNTTMVEEVKMEVLGCKHYKRACMK